MAAPRGTFGRGRAPAAPAGATLEDCFAEAEAGRAASVYLFDGDAFLALRAARELAHRLVPEDQRSLNLLELDAAASPGEVAGELRTRGLFSSGGKVVLVQEPAFLTSKEDVEESFGRAVEQWGEGRQREAARRLLALAGKAGLGATDLLPAPGEEPAKARTAVAKRLKKELGFLPDEAGLAFVEAAAAFALEREMKPPKDDTGALDDLLAAGFPPGHVLVVAAGKVDGKLPLVKKLAEAGRRVKTAIEREPNFEAKPILGPAVVALLAGTGKRADPAAVERLRELVDADARALATELQKLVAYTGDRKLIEVADVDAVVTRVASDPFFALGNAVEARDLAEALGVVDRSIADGGHPIMLLSTVAGTLRRLVVEKERARKAAGSRRIASSRDWESVVFPTIPEEEVGKKKPYGFWMKYQASTRYSLGELLDAIAGLAEADVGMKSGQDARMALERVLVALLAPETRGRKTP
jgi:DNA polymerase-3 subunit delta